MNIKITYNWLLEYVDTDATPPEIQKYLSLCGPSVERVEQVGNDHVFDIEVTSNRVDMASVLGIAQEAVAILPRFGKHAALRYNPLSTSTFAQLEKATGEMELIVRPIDPTLCPRFSAVILSNVKIDKSPDFIKQRLISSGIKSINNVVDISNYIMVTLGQPVHMFDYDKIKDHAMIVRMSKKGEKIVTLDEKTLRLPGDDIVIEDGSGKLIDLCGIMGGLNSSINAETKNVVLFVQTYNKQKIRRTSMVTGQRTMAATYFEKGMDPERVGPALVYGTELLKKYAQGKVASMLYDIYPDPVVAPLIKTDVNFINERLGIDLKCQEIKKILTSLNFKVDVENENLSITPPSYRYQDVIIPEDVVEEVARIWGYHNFSSVVQPTVAIKQPREIEQLFYYQSKVKHFLADIGLHEVMNYSMISRETVLNNNLAVMDHLRLKNSLSTEIEYLRRYITPSLIADIKQNEGIESDLRFFEIAKGYKPQVGNLPHEYYQFSIATNTSYADLKGIIDALFDKFNVTGFDIKKSSFPMFESSIQAEIEIDGELVGKFGQLSPIIADKCGLKSKVFIAYFKFEKLINYFKELPMYQSINPYAVIKLDLTMVESPNFPYVKIVKIATKTSAYLKHVELVSVYQNKISLRFYFTTTDRNLTEEEAKKELEKIKANLHT